MRKQSKKQDSKSYIIIAFLIIGAIIYGFATGKIGPKYDGSTVSPQIEIENGTLALHMIDIGQGDAFLLQLDGKYALIDAGPGANENKLMNYLESAGVSTLEYAVFTHPHEDHIGGADNVLNSLNVKRVLIPKKETTTSCFEKMLTAIDRKNTPTDFPSPGDSYTFGNAKLTVLAPVSDDYDGLNEYSIVIRVDYKNTSMLLTGDAETVNEKEILNSEYADLLNCDLLKLGHHGSLSSTGKNFLEAVSPEIAFISCGADNDYGHPHDETLEKLNKYGCKIFRTDLCGTVIAYSDGETIKVSTEFN